MAITHTRTITLPNQLGLHTRASSKLYDCANRFSGHIQLHCQGRQADAKRIMEVLTLGAGHQATITVETQGEDAQAALDAICELLEQGFGEC